MNQENNESLSETKHGSNEEIAFRDFEKSVSTREFVVVLDIMKEEYDRLKEFCDSRDKFNKRADKGIEQLREQENHMPPGLLDKLVEGIVRKANRKIQEEIGDAIVRAKEVVDFLNRFQPSDALYPELDFSFIKNV